MKRMRFVLPALVLAGLLTASTAAAAVTPVMTGLDNPRGLAFDPEGALYVAEAGRGGTGPCIVLRGALQCYGPTGRVSRLWRGVQSEYATGLPSYVTTAGSEPPGQATGPHDISFLGRGNARVTIGWGENPLLRNTPPSSVWQQFDRLARVVGSGSWWLEEDIGAYELAANPDGGPLDSNAYGALVLPGRTLVTDAGGNDLLEVRSNGDISTLAVFPSRPGRPTDSVPTAVTVGPDGAFYVGELTGVPFAAAAANVYRVVPGQPPAVHCGGFTTITDLTWGPDGNLYVAQHSNGPVFFGLPGDVVRVGPGCSKTPVTPPLNRPGSLAFGPDGRLYVSINSNSVGIGQVVRIDP